MKDIVPDLLEAIDKEFNLQVSESVELKKAIKALNAKAATYSDANAFAIEIGDILAQTLGNNVSADILPDGKMYYNIAERLINTTLSKNYELISGYAVDVQTQLNQRAGIGILGQKADLNQNRIDGIVNKISTEDDFEKVVWLLDEPIKNFSQSIVDDTIKKNVEFQARAGLKPKVVRLSSGKCCAWCDAVAGTYEYPDVPKDVYRRHRYCRCRVEYDPGDGKRQNVHTKKWIDPEKDAKIEVRKLIGKDQEKEILSEKHLRDAIKNEEILDVVNEKKQSRHIEGNTNGRSYINRGEDIELLYQELKGTGTAVMSEQGWTKKERVKAEKMIGVYADKDGNKTETNKLMIVYSKTGSHMYPRR